MRYMTVCSGIEAPSAAWGPLGWEPVAFSEIEPFPCAVLKHHYPDVPNLGDMTKWREWDIDDLRPIDLIAGGTPCQSFSVAGLRGGLADPRGNLALGFLAIVDAVRPTWVAWENVPGVLSSNDGRDFGAFLGALGQLGYGWSYRVLDAQYVRVDGFARAVPQRRRRVFVVGHLGDWRRAAAVLFERESLSGHPAPRRSKGQDAPTIPASGAGTERTGNEGTEVELTVARSLRARANASHREDSDNYVAHALTSEGFDASEDGGGRGTPLVAAPLVARQGKGAFTDPVNDNVLAVRTAQTSANGCGTTEGVYTLDEAQGRAVAFTQNQEGDVLTGDIAASMGTNQNATGRNRPKVSQGMAVRRLTPVECARLMGFPDDYLAQVEWRGKTPPPDGPMYRALGNSQCVNVMRWIGRRIEMVEEVRTP